MTVHFISNPVRSLQGDITVPGDKSISHRAVILGALAKGKTSISGFLQGEDCLATIKAFRAMGLTIEGPDSGKVLVHGVGIHGLQAPEKPLDCGNSGTSMRLLAGILSAQPFNSELYGDASLNRRPMERISHPLTLMGAKISTTEGKPPLLIRGGARLEGICYEMPVASAQVKSCLLLAGLYAKGKTIIVEPGPSRDHTEKMLEIFSCDIEKTGNRITISSNNEYRGTAIQVPADISSAAFFLVAASIIPGSDIYIRNVGLNPTRTGILTILKQMGANISCENLRSYGKEPVGDLHVQYAPLQGITIAPELVPLAIDEFPIIFIAAACAKGETTLSGAAELRSKESDRIASMIKGLQQTGIEAQALDDGVWIRGGKFEGGLVDSFHDHRIAMAFAIAGAVAKNPVRIENCSNVATSFPNFVQTANKLHLAIQEIPDEE